MPQVPTPVATTSPAKTAEKYKAEEIAEVTIIEGKWSGKWLKCKIVGSGSARDTYIIHVLPTRDYDNAAGFSDHIVQDMHKDYLCKVTTAPASTSPAKIAVDTD